MAKETASALDGMSDVTNPILVETTRGPLVENRHRAAVAISANTGVVENWGDIDRLIYPRSSYKILQAIPLVESGTADRLRLSHAHLALACASHDGDPMHTDRVSDWLAYLGLSEAALMCGPQTPRKLSAVAALPPESVGGTPLHNNCSGKHAGFLSLAVGLDVDPSNYISPTHTVQQRVRTAIEEMTGTDACDVFGVDGCSAPNFAVTLRGLAQAMAKVAAPERLSTERAEAVTRLRTAMALHPDLIAGEGRACTDFIRVTDGAGICKTGADGVFTAIVPRRGLGIALKIDDGDTAAAEALMAAILVRLGLASSDEPRIAARLATPILDRCGTAVGARRCTLA